MVRMSSTPILAVLAVLFNTGIASAARLTITRPESGGVHRPVFVGAHVMPGNEMHGYQPSYIYDTGDDVQRQAFTVRIGPTIGETAHCRIYPQGKERDITMTFENRGGRLKLNKCGCHDGWRIQCWKPTSTKSDSKSQPKVNCDDSQVRPDTCSECSKSSAELGQGSRC